MKKRTVLTAALAAAGCAATALAQPANDLCANAIVIGQNDTMSGDNLLATTEWDDLAGSFSCRSSGGDVWFSLTAAATGVQEIRLCASDYDTVLHIFDTDCTTILADDGSMGSTVACVDTDFFICLGNNVSSPQSAWRFDAMAGTTYMIRVAGDGADPSFQTGNWTIDTEAYPAPANDTIANAIELMENDAIVADNTGALSEEPASQYVCSNGSVRTLWYEFTPVTSKRYQFSTCGSAVNTNCFVFESTDGTAAGVDINTPFAFDCQNDDFCEPETSGTGRAAPDADLDAGTTYFIMIGTESNNDDNPRTGDINLSITEWTAPLGACCLPAFAGCSDVTEADCTVLGGNYFGDFTVCGFNGAFCPQENDVCSGATEVFLNTPLFAYDPIGNTATGGTSDCDFNTSNSLNDSWFVFTAPATDIYTFSTCGSLFSSLRMAVYEDCADQMRGEIKCVSNDQNGSCFDLENPVMNLMLQGGEDYVIRMSGHQNNGLGAFVMDFEITVYDAPTGVCCLPDMTTVNTDDADCASQGGVWVGAFESGDCFTLPPNNSCETASMLVVDDAPVVGSKGNTTLIGDCRGNLEEGDSWYTFDALANHTYALNVTESSTVDVYTDCGPLKREIICGFGGDQFLAPPTDGPIYINVAPRFSDLDYMIDVDLVSIPTGACCTDTGCVVISEEDCIAAGGAFQGDFVACFTSPYEYAGLSAPIEGSPFGCLPSGPFVASVADDIMIDELVVQVVLNTTFGGELDIRLTGPGAQEVILMEKALSPDCECGNPTAPSANMIGTYTFTDSSFQSVDEYIAATWDGVAFSIDIPEGDYRVAGCLNAMQSLNTTFGGMSTMGDWNLTITDEGTGFGPGFSEFITYRLLVNGGTPSCPCPCDDDMSGEVDVLDLLTFLDDWFANDPAADFNGDMIINVLDLLDYLSCWFDASTTGLC